MNLFRTVIRTGLIAGTLDILAAVMILGKMNFTSTLKFIASGMFGSDAFTGGTEMVVAGLLFHYFTALSFTTAWFMIYPFLPAFFKNVVLTGILIGISTWGIMNLAVIPLSRVSAGKTSLYSALLNVGILTVCIGLPIALATKRFFSEKA